MGKAWEYFKTEKDVFLAVANNVSLEEKNLLKKKFGKDFDGINVKTSIKKNEMNDFNLTCKKVMIEIDFAEKVKKNGKIMSSYLSDKNYDFLKKIMYAYNINKNALDDIINSLAKGERTSFLYYFGIDRKRMTISAIADLLNTDEIHVYTNISSALETIKRKIYKHVEAKSNVTKKQDNQAPMSLVNPLIKKGYTLLEIINAIKEYDENVIGVLKKLYGNSFNNTRSLMIKVSPEDTEIVLNILNGNDNIESKIIKAQEEKQKHKTENVLPTYFKGNLQTYYQKRGYTKGEFINAFRELSSEEKQKLFMCFDHSFNSLDIAELPKSVVNSSYATAFSPLIGIQHHLINNRKNNSKKENINLYEVLCKKEYSKKIVDLALDNLKDEDKNELHQYFDKDGNLIKSYDNNVLIKNLLFITIPRTLKKYKETEDLLNRFKNGIYEEFKNSKKAYVDIAILNLNDKESEIYSKSFDENGMLKPNSEYNTEIIYILKNKISTKIKEILEMDKASRNLDEYLSKFAIDKKQVEIILSNLSDEDKKVLSTYYNENLIRKSNVNFDVTIYSLITSIIQQFKQFNLKNYYENLSKKNILQAIERLSPSDKIIFDEYFDENLNLKTIFNASKNPEIYIIITEKIKNERKVRKGTNIYERSKKHGYERNIVDIAIETLNETQKKYFFNEYDKNGNKIGNSKNMSVFISTTFYKKLDNILKFMNDTKFLIEYFEHQGIEKDEFLEFISLLDYQLEEKIKYYYDENLIRKESIVFNIDTYNFLIQLTNEIVSSKNKQHKYNFYKSWENRGYKRIYIDIAISLLPDEAKNAFREAFDEYGYRIKPLKECFDNSTSPYHYLYTIIKRNLNIISNFINETVSLYDYFVKEGYSNREVDYVITSLDKNDRLYFDSYYDNNLVRNPNKEFSVELYKLLNKIEISLRKVNLYTKYELLGYSRDDVVQVISKLNHLEQLMLYKYFDKDLNVIKDYSGAPRVVKLINVVIVEYMKKNKNEDTISEEKDEQKDLSLFEEYISSIKKLNIFSKEFISSLNMSNKEKYYLTVEFVFNEQSTFKSEKLAKFLNLEYKDYVSKVYQAMMKARNELSTKFDNSLESIKKVLD